MIRLEMIVNVLFYQIEIKIKLKRKKAYFYVGYRNRQHINN
ncbi:hypothetical protein [Faecalicoccus acidiformans]|nr:hypothetical protein [Faecalicoccus acidiformans]